MRTPRAAIIAVSLIVLLGAAIRLPGIFTDFWLDEIWSLDIARGIEPPRIDNNHLLNTWMIQAIGTKVRQWWIYRLPALMFGVGSVALAAFVMRRRSVAEMLAAAILVALSFPFVFYSSEARGYAPVVFFALLALESMLADAEHPRAATAIVFNLACILGFLSHLTFVHFYFAAMCFTIFTSKRNVLRWVRLNTVPICFAAMLYRFFVRDITIGGAASRDPVSVLIESLSVPFGGPPVGPAAKILVGVAIAIFISAIVILIRRRDRLWIFYVLAIVIAPAFFLTYDLVLSSRPQPLMLRYFLVAIVMLLLCAAHVAGAMWKSGPPGRVIVVALLLAFAIANIYKTADFLRYGRGGYSLAVRRIFEASPDRVVTVDADNEFASGRLVDFYAWRLAPPGRSIDFRHTRAAATQASHPPEWVIISDPSRVARMSAVTESNDHDIYQLDSEYPCQSLSGAPWLLYRIDIAASNSRKRAR